MEEVQRTGKEKEERNYSEGEEITFQGSSVRIFRIVTLPCPRNGQGRKGSDFFPWAKAYLCYFEIQSFGVIKVSGFRISGEPEEELRRWHFDPPETVDEEWDELQLFCQSPEAAVSSRLQDINEILQESSLDITCRSCKQRKRCEDQRESLIKQTPLLSFFELVITRGLGKRRIRNDVIKEGE